MALRAFALTLGLLLVPLLPASGAEVIKDGSFESTPVDQDNPNWQQGGFFAPICDVDTCGDGGGTAGPRTGRNWAFFGGVPTADFEFVSQTVQIPRGAATLTFWLRHGRSNGAPLDAFRVFMGDDEIFELVEGSAGYSVYKQVTVDVTRYGTGAPNNLSFEFQGFGGTPPTNFSLDDISLQAGSAAPSGVVLRGPKRVPQGKKAKLTSMIQPCTGHAGDVIELYRGKKRVGSRPSDAACTAVFKVRIKKASTFRAVVSGVSSNKLRVRPRR